MFNIEQFLKRFTTITPPDSEVRKCTAHITKKEIGIFLKEEDISVQNKVVYIKTSPAIKSRIFVKKEHIISHMREVLGEGVVTDIR